MGDQMVINILPRYEDVVYSSFFSLARIPPYFFSDAAQVSIGLSFDSFFSAARLLSCHGLLNVYVCDVPRI